MEKRKKEKKKKQTDQFQRQQGSLKLGAHGFSQTESDHWFINMNKNFNYNDIYIYIYIYIYITVMGKSTNFFIFKNSKLKSKIGCYQIYLLKKLRK